MLDATRLLLIEQSPTDALLVTCRLRQIWPEIEVTRATTCAAGLQVLADSDHPTHIILSSLSLPDTTGLDGIEQLLEAAGDTPLLVLADEDSDALAVSAVKMGAQDYLYRGDIPSLRLRRLLKHVLVRSRAASAQHRTMRDALTGDLSREGIEAVLASAPTSSMVLLFSLDRFKAINETFGHTIGDRLLCELSARLRRALRGAQIARMRGDEFVAVLTLPPTGSTNAAVERLREALEAPYTFGGICAEIGVSIGVVRKHEVDTVSSVLKRADAAMFQSKEARARAQATGKIQSLYTNHGTTGGVRILPNVISRWSRSIVERWLDVAAETASSRGLTFLHLPAPALPPDLVSLVRDRLAAWDCPPSRLCLMLGELTEVDPLLQNRLDELIKTGVRIGLDGVGGRHGGLDLLLSMPLDFVTFSPRLMALCPDSPRAIRLLKGVVEVCQEEGVTIILPPQTAAAAVSWAHRLGPLLSDIHPSRLRERLRSDRDAPVAPENLLMLSERLRKQTELLRSRSSVLRNWSMNLHRRSS